MTDGHKKLHSLLTAFAADVLSAFGIPGGSSLGLAVKSLMEKRQRQAREILLQELRCGERALADAETEEAAAIFYRYIRAATEGAARINLRLMAKVIAGQVQTRALHANEFLRYAEILASLTRDEIVAIATLHSIRKEIDDLPGGRQLYGHTIWERLTRELVPFFVASEDHLRSLVTGATRSGLIISLTGLDDLGYFATSPLMDELEKLASFEETLAVES